MDDFPYVHCMHDKQRLGFHALKIRLRHAAQYGQARLSERQFLFHSIGIEILDPE